MEPTEVTYQPTISEMLRVHTSEVSWVVDSLVDTFLAMVRTIILATVQQIWGMMGDVGGPIARGDSITALVPFLYFFHFRL